MPGVSVRRDYSHYTTYASTDFDNSISGIVK